ncbi:MAG: beta-lactamase regulating signal transducer with metallopeptidase domain, partial [Polaribacter sp.]
HGLLRMLSDKYGGAMVSPNNISTISELVKAKKSVKPTIYQTSKTISVINLKWIFFILLTLLTLEWFLRRYYGGY